MKTILTSVVAGFLGAFIATSFREPIFASDSSAAVSGSVINDNCRLVVGRGRPTGGMECFRDEVMVGHWDNLNYCATIQVVCN